MKTFGLITVEFQKVMGSSPLIPFDEWVELSGEKKQEDYINTVLKKICQICIYKQKWK